MRYQAYSALLGWNEGRLLHEPAILTARNHFALFARFLSCDKYGEVAEVAPKTSRTVHEVIHEDFCMLSIQRRSTCSNLHLYLIVHTVQLPARKRTPSLCCVIRLILGWLSDYMRADPEPRYQRIPRSLLTNYTYFTPRLNQ